jgi:hypothetical protein
MKHTYLTIVFIAFQLISCNAQKSQVSNKTAEELKWKKVWIDIFFQEYRTYQEDVLSTCHDKDRSVSFDIERKIRAIHQFPFGVTLSELKIFLETNPIEYDSLIMDNSHSWHNEEGLDYAPVSFYLYTKEGIRMLVVSFDANQKPTIKEHKEDVIEFYENAKNLQNGCGYGFNTFTAFNNDLLSWKIKRIVINPSE